MESWQVNININADDVSSAFISRFSLDGYQGVTINTRYADGCTDETDWAVFVGTKEECQQYVDEFNSAALDTNH